MSRLAPLAIALSLTVVLAAAPQALAKKRHAGASSSAGSGYYTPYLTGPNGERTPIMDVPGSATVINRQILDDQQATSLSEALRNAPGVTIGR